MGKNPKAGHAYLVRYDLYMKHEINALNELAETALLLVNRYTFLGKVDGMYLSQLQRRLERLERVRKKRRAWEKG